MTGDLILQSDSEATAVAFTADSGSLAAICKDGKIRVWNVSTGAVTRTWDRDKDARVMFAGPRGQYAVIAADGKLSLRGIGDNASIRELEGPKPRAASVTSAQQGGFLAAAGRPYEGSSENLIRVWNGSGREQFQLPAGLGGVSALAFSPDGKTLVAAANDTDLRVWSVKNGELERLIDEMLVTMFELAFSPDGKYLAAAGVDRTIYLWDASSWKLTRKITGQPEMISALEFSPDSKRIASGGMNEMLFGAPVKVIVWDVASGKPVRTVDAAHRVGAVSFAPDGKLLAVADSQKSVYLWALP